MRLPTSQVGGTVRPPYEACGPTESPKDGIMLRRDEDGWHAVTRRGGKVTAKSSNIAWGMLG